MLRPLHNSATPFYHLKGFSNIWGTGLFQKAIELDPNYAEAYNNLAICYYWQGNIEEANNTWYEQCSNFLNLVNQAEKLFSKGNGEQKREILSSIYSNLILKDKKVLVDYKKPFDLLVSTRGEVVLAGSRIKTLANF